jgi:transposase
VHDCWAPYDGYDQVTHALCNAHALRELQAVTDAAPPGQWCWATQGADALRDLKRLADASLAIDGTLRHAGRAKTSEIRHRCHSALLIGKSQTAARAGPLIRKHHALAKRLLAREGDYLRFTADPRVPFDNNAAEREVRMGKLRIKVSGCMRSMAGAEAFCAIRSYLSTAAKHGIGKLDALTQAATGTPWVPETTREPVPGGLPETARWLALSAAAGPGTLAISIHLPRHYLRQSRPGPGRQSGRRGGRGPGAGRRIWRGHLQLRAVGLEGRRSG